MALTDGGLFVYERFIGVTRDPCGCARLLDGEQVAFCPEHASEKEKRMEKTIEVTADVLVSVKFRMAVDGGASLDETEKLARERAERLAAAATAPVGASSSSASATVQRIASFSTRTGDGR